MWSPRQVKSPPFMPPLPSSMSPTPSPRVITTLLSVPVRFFIGVVYLVPYIDSQDFTLASTILPKLL